MSEWVYGGVCACGSRGGWVGGCGDARVYV